MNKKLIRLTESDLHKIVKESVNMILKEVKYGGESLHGNNSKDWYALSQIRGYRDNDKYGHKKYQTKAEYDDEYGKGLRDFDNGLSLDGMEHERCENGFIPYIDNDEVREKTNRIRSKMPKLKKIK